MAEITLDNAKSTPSETLEMVPFSWEDTKKITLNAREMLGPLQALQQEKVREVADAFRTEVAEYCKHSGRQEIEDWPFYLIYNMFRSAGIIQGVYKRGLDGNASSQTALEYADVARLRSERGWALAEEFISSKA